ncbi:major facilitator superfamily domain-containing protein [Plectosphaerella plurivora]|uniref:Major facilitator superfamily domain-containing protein n=1 Tax=Plectosphaerella plurivora TaxID=936078 RepID=A0A9P8V1E5_9PEZI|nr:major facilitator superfamily domain-containing protein [Plectosphaerella plurivora]
MDEKAIRASSPSDTDVEAAHPEDASHQQQLEKTAAGTDRPSSPDSSNADIIDWKGPDDPELPINWPRAKKWRNVLLVATLTFLTPFASSMFAPAISQVMSEMGTTNRDIGSFGVSIYLLGYAFGPLFLAPCSELYGRLPVYHICSVLFVIMNVACGLSVNMPMLIIFRFLTGLVGACPLTVGPGTVSDCFHQEERGRAMAVWTMPVLLGPCIGPAVGAYVSRGLGWRWNFWLLIIMVPETHPPTLLKNKARRLRKSGEMPNARPATNTDKTRQQVMTSSIVRPIKMLFLSPIIFGLSLLTAVAYGILYLLFTTVTDVFRTRYGIVTNVGLIYLGFGCGQFAGLFLFGAVSDAIVKKMSRGGQMKPEYRLPPMIPGGAMIPVGLLLYGWTAQYRVFWFVPVIGTFLIGFGMITVFTPVGTYLVDAFPTYAASATAANTVFRSVGGALLPLAGPRMYETLDQGWGNTLLAGISLLTMGMIWVALKYGERLRTHPKYQLNL